MRDLGDPTGPRGGLLSESARKSERRVLRLAAYLLAGIAVTMIVTSRTVVVQPTALDIPAWYRWLMSLVVALPLLTGVLAAMVGARTIRALCACTVLSHVCLLVLLVPAVTVGEGALPEGQVPWLLTASSTVVISAVIAWGQWGGWFTLLVVTACTQVLRWVFSDNSPNAVVNDVQVLVMSMVALILTSALIVSSRDLDEAVLHASVAESRTATERARRSAQLHTQGVVHDEVLTALLLAARHFGMMREAIAQQAARALTLIRGLSGSNGPSGRGLSVPAFADMIKSAVRDIDPRASVEFVVGGAKGQRPPSRASQDRAAASTEIVEVTARAVAAFRGATAQAMVNSLKHAGPGAIRAVTVSVGRSGVTVRIVDDGVGFLPAAVITDRMGISTSIVDRMTDLPGGSAEIDSRVGAGTTVTLGWLPVRAHDGAGLWVGADTAEVILDSELARQRTRARALAKGLRLALVIFVASQLCLAVVTAVYSGELQPALPEFLGIVAALWALGWNTLSRPSPRRTAAVLVITTGTAGMIFWPSQRDDLQYWDAWYITGCSFVLLALALRNRPGFATLGVALISMVTVAGVVAHGYDTGEVAASITRPVIFVIVATAVTVVINRTRAKVKRWRATELNAVRAQAYDETSRRELHRNSQELDVLIGPVLERLAGEDEISAELAGDCAALEGRLRDQYRSGRLYREPLITAAMTARRGGVDVVLIDEDPALRNGAEGAASWADIQADLVARWMSDRLGEVDAGKFTGRMLPASRPGVASVVVDERSQLFSDAVADVKGA